MVVIAQSSRKLHRKIIACCHFRGYTIQRAEVGWDKSQRLPTRGMARQGSSIRRRADCAAAGEAIQAPVARGKD
jgi:hypothetical protein